MPKPEILTPHQLTLARARLRKHYREGTLTQTAIDLLETIPGWKWEPNKRKTTEEFIAELNEKNPNIEVVGEYTTNNNPIKVRCKKCEHTWSPLPNSLLQGTGCPKCYINSRRKTTKHFKAELAKVNPSIEVIGEYITSKTPIQVWCVICNHTWSPTPNSLLCGAGCPKCAGHIPKTTEQFKKELKEINLNIEVIGDYISANKPIKVRCKKCDYVWIPIPARLLRGQGCPKCAHRIRKTTEQFKAELAKVNPNIEVIGEYINTKTPIKVRCKKCGHVWEPVPNSLLRGTSCPKCAHRIRKTTEQFKSELTKANPNIEVIGEYIGVNKPIKVRCRVCDYVWTSEAQNLKRDHGCPKCAGQVPKTTEQFKAELAKVNPSVEITGEYISAKKPINVRCKVCGHTWSPIPNSLLCGHGCPMCAAQNRRKAVCCVETGEIYPSQTAAAKAVGLKTSDPISRVVHGYAQTAAGYHWEYA